MNVLSCSHHKSFISITGDQSECITRDNSECFSSTCLICSIRSQLKYEAWESAVAGISGRRRDDTQSSWHIVWYRHWLTGVVCGLLLFAESPLGQDTNSQDRKLQCLPPQQAQRPVQRSSGAHGKKRLWTAQTPQRYPQHTWHTYICRTSTDGTKWPHLRAFLKENSSEDFRMSHNHVIGCRPCLSML